MHWKAYATRCLILAACDNGVRKGLYLNFARQAGARCRKLYAELNQLKTAGEVRARVPTSLGKSDEALALLNELVGRWDTPGFFECSHQDLVDRARAAIAKAKGEEVTA